MMFNLVVNRNDPPLGAIVMLSRLNKMDFITLGDENLLTSQGLKLKTESSMMRYIAQLNFALKWYGETVVEKCEIEHWMSFSIGPLVSNRISESLAYLEQSLAPVRYLVGNRITVADYAVWSKLHGKFNEAGPNVTRWYREILNENYIPQAIAMLPAKENVEVKQEGKFVDLPGAEMGKVVVRFPPEASGYLHIGHAKAALLNQYYKEVFNGKLIMRFDDTNPAKEKENFEHAILEDLKMLKVEYDRFTRTSDYFDLMLDLCEKLIKEGKAYVDDTDPETMKNEREQKVESKNRNNAVEKNLKMWQDMKKGTEFGQKCCVRAKINMASLNGCMRDPTIYRCKNEPHPRTGEKYKVYPTYDFACPIVDSIEGVTHCLRTMEYHDRDEQFFWFIEALGLRKPYIYEYSRLNMTNTVLSKRKLTWFVDSGMVNGWDDPRMPTVRGVLRRGMTVEGLRQFIISQGSSRSVVIMEWDKIWSINKKVIDPIAPRYTVIDANNNSLVRIKGVKEEQLSVAKHPKNAEIGEKKIWIGPEILVDEADAALFKVGENVTFINWGNIMIKNIQKVDGKLVIDAEPNLEDKNFKKTLKITWLAKTIQAPLIPVKGVFYEHIISKPVLGKDEDFKSYVGHQTEHVVDLLGEPVLKDLKKSDIVQLQRKGFFICDRSYHSFSVHSCEESPLCLLAIPDGHTKDMPTAVAPKNTEPQKADIKNISIKITDQGEKVRSLKAQKANKDAIKKEVDLLLALKSEYKTATGQDWKPDVPVPEVKKESSPNVNDLLNKISSQGDKIRNLKAQKADKDAIKKEVDALLSLKSEYKSVTGQEWKPDLVQEVKKESSPNVKDLLNKISSQGDKIRNLKSQKADKDSIKKEVDALLSLKSEYKTITGQEWKPDVVQEMKKEPSPNVNDLLNKISSQGDKIRNLKSQKADKDSIKKEVDALLSLKSEYKTITGQEWKPDLVQEVKKESSPNVNDLLNKISSQGDKIRNLKSQKADKDSIKKEVDGLLSLKSEFKTITGQEWKPDLGQEVKKESSSNVNDLLNKISSQGDKIRILKAHKADKDTIKKEVDALLALKSEFKTTTGQEWEPDLGQEVNKESSSNVNDLLNKISSQGDKIRILKAQKADKDTIKKEVDALLALKSEFKTTTGQEWKPNSLNKINSQGDVIKKDVDKPITGQERKPEVDNKEAPKKQKEEKHQMSKKQEKKDSSLKKITRLGLEATKEENLPDWYSQVITKAEMIEYYDVSGCYILRPWSFAIWESLKDWFDEKIKSLGVKNCYFPIFVSRSVLEKEKNHISDFAPEVAWVTKSGDSDMAEPIAIRPTSETVMYPAYAKWIQSYRDLPIKLNQWNNVVRWEFKHPQPFLRTREFLWQEGHTAFATSKEAEEEVYTILDLYAEVYTDLLAVPVVKGRKTEKEKFAGGDYTLTVEAFISASGRAIQGATSHHLGQNFSKMFDVVYEDPETQEKKFVYQNSWGMTTRTIGVLIMIHADNQGLVLPPKVASIQTIIVPCGITVNLKEDVKIKLLKACEDLRFKLKENGVLAETDLRDNYSPGWKFNHWELKGVPIRIEIGPKDLSNDQIVAVRRDTGTKSTFSNETAIKDLKQLLDRIQKDMLQKATAELHKHMVVSTNWKEFCENLEKKNIIQSPFCGEIECEDKIKADSARNDEEQDSNAPSMGAKSLCIPFEPIDKLKPSDKCIYPKCTKTPKYYTLFGRSY